MNQDIGFSYIYSAKENKEILEIRKKYLPREESKLDELKRLDKIVQTSGTVESLCAGIGGVLIFGLGMCFSMQVIGSGVLMQIAGILLGLAGGIVMIVAYPIYQNVYNKTKEKHTPRILELAEALS